MVCRKVFACLKIACTLVPLAGRCTARGMNPDVCIDLLGLPSVRVGCPRRARSPEDASCIVERVLEGRSTDVFEVVVVDARELLRGRLDLWSAEEVVPRMRRCAGSATWLCTSGPE